MLMGFVSYASIVDKQTLDATIAEIRKTSLAQTQFEKDQEEVSTGVVEPANLGIMTSVLECISIMLTKPLVGGGNNRPSSNNSATLPLPTSKPSASPAS